MDHLNAQAAGVIISGSHSCMSCRGVRKQATMTTSAMFGRLRDEPAMRAEFLKLTNL
jgi:GTP cyclohydrolase I